MIIASTRRLTIDIKNKLQASTIELTNEIVRCVEPACQSYQFDIEQ